MKHIKKVECRGHGQFLLLRMTDAGGEKHDLGLDAVVLDELLRYLAGILVSPGVPDAIRGVLQVLAAREVRISMHGAATPVLIQELEAGVPVVTTIDREDLQRLRDDCDKALAAMPPPSSH